MEKRKEKRQAVLDKEKQNWEKTSDNYKMQIEKTREEIDALNAKKPESSEKDKAEATVDTYINKGIIIPKQKDVAIKLCLNDPETFQELYRDAKPIIELDPKPHSKKVDTDVNKIVDFFKN